MKFCNFISVMMIIQEFAPTAGQMTSSLRRTVRHRVQKTGKSRSLKKFGYTQEIVLLFRPNCCPLLVHL